MLVYLCFVLLDLTSVIFAMFFKLESLCTHVGLNLLVQFNDLVSRACSEKTMISIIFSHLEISFIGKLCSWGLRNKMINNALRVSCIIAQDVMIAILL